jgi:hypothetical protein
VVVFSRAEVVRNESHIVHSGGLKVVITSSSSTLGSSLTVLSNSSRSVSANLHSNSTRVLPSEIPGARVDVTLATEVTSTRNIRSIVILMNLVLLRIVPEVL